MEYVTYKLRWLLLAAVCIVTFCRSYSAASFVMANGVVAEYFNVTPFRIDVAVNIETGLAIVVCFVVPAFAGRIGVRAVSIMSSTAMLISVVVSACSFFSRRFYWLLLIGRCVSSITMGFLFTLPLILSAAWFPPKQLSTAFALPFVSLFLGDMISSLVFARTPGIDVQDNVTIQYNSTFSAPAEYFVLNFGVQAVVLVIVTILLCAYADDQPPTPPSGSQDLLLQQKSNNTLGDLSKILPKCSETLRDYSFAMITLTSFLSNSAASLPYYISASLLRATFPDLPTSVLGFLMMAIFFNGLKGAIVAGRVLDKYKVFKKMSVIGTIGVVLSSVAMFFGHFFQQLTVLVIFYSINAFARAATVTSMTEFLMEVTYPSDKLLVASLHFGFYYLGMFVMTVLNRLAMDAWGEEHTSTISGVANVVALICILLVPANYKRTKANTALDEEDESTNLLKE